MMESLLDDAGQDLIFRTSRTHRFWQDKAISDTTLLELYDLFKWGPTSGNCCPARVVFVKSGEAKEKLKPCLAKGNVDQTMAAPATAIVAHDMEFFEQLPTLAPHADTRSWYLGKPDLISSTAIRNGSLQGAYLILAARALGLDCGPMSGFNSAAVDEAFFQGSSWTVNFLVNLGYGLDEKLHPRAPRLSFEEACRID